ncbi:MAG: c-type cytochrome [Steroidobacteraceae bacterium]|nr:c-type cytochrome [Steroidobacteraceae bacterium]
MLTRHLNWFVCILAAQALATTASAQTPAEQGRVLFEQLCTACHSVGGGDRVGPDLAGVTQRREVAWLKRMIREPDALIAEGDPVVTALVERYGGIIMPKLGLDEAKAEAIVSHLSALDAGAAAPRPRAVVYGTPELMQPQARIWQMFLLISAVIVLVFAVVAFSTRSPREVSSERAYGLRRVLFLATLVAAIGVLAATFPKTPYAAHSGAATAGVDRIVYVAARQFEFIWSDEPIASVEDVGRVPRLDQVMVDAGATVEFRVTSLDVNHGFGLYGPQRQIVAQTQAMPGYINRLRVRLDTPGEYPVFCLEYCAAGHHRMRSSLIVR